MTTIAAWLGGCGLPRLEARMLVQQASGLSAAQLIIRDQECLDGAVLAQLNDWAARRLAGEPMAYLLGWREFYGRRFAVSPAVLIPRPETEHLLEAALAKLPHGGSLWDLGTGSGVLAVSAKLERGDARVWASDISADALQVAQHNAKTLGAAVDFAQGSWFDAAVDAMPTQFDVLVSNPPYIEKDDVHLQQGDLRFEPQGALSDFGDGLGCIRVLAAGAPARLKKNGWLLLEHGYNQGSSVRSVLQQQGFADVATEQDWAGLDRITLGRLP